MRPWVRGAAFTAWLIAAHAPCFLPAVAAQDTALPEVARELIEQGERHRAAGRTEDAVAAYREAQRLAPEAVETYAALGALYFSAGRDEEALAAFTGGLERVPEDPGLLSNAAVVSLRLERFDEALGWIEKALAQRPRDARGQALRGVALRELGRPTEALMALQEAVRIDGKDAQLHYRLGNLYYELERKTEAIEAYRKAVRLDRDFQRAYFNLGAVFFEVGRDDEALDAYRIALEPVDKALRSGQQVDAANAKAYFNLGTIYSRRGDLVAAADAFEKGLGLAPGDSQALYSLGQVRFAAGDEAAASAAYEEALRADPELPLAYLHLGQLAQQRGDAEAAVRWLEEGVPRLAGVDRVDAYRTLAAAERSRGRDEAAAAAYREVLTVAPDDVQALLELGRIERAGGDLEAAGQVLERARALAPERAAVLFELASLAKAKGDLDGQKRLYGELLGRVGGGGRGPISPAVRSLRLNLARVHLQLGERAAARRVLEPLMRRRGGAGDGPDGRLVATAFGLLLIAEGSHTEAEAHLRKVGGDAAADALAVLALLRGPATSAIGGLEASRARHAEGPLAAIADANLGQALWLAGRGEQARPHLEQATAALPDWLGPRAALGALDLAAGDTVAAVSRLEPASASCRAVSLPNPPAVEGRLQVLLGGDSASVERLCGFVDDTLARAFVGAALDGAKRPGGGAAYAERALSQTLTPEERAAALFVRGTARLAAGAVAGAVADLAAAVDGTLPADLRPAALNNLGAARLRAGDVGVARQLFERAGGGPEAVLNLAILLDDHAGEPERALELYERYLELGGSRRQEVAGWAERLRRIYR